MKKNASEQKKKEEEEGVTLGDERGVPGKQGCSKHHLSVQVCGKWECGSLCRAQKQQPGIDDGRQCR